VGLCGVCVCDVCECVCVCGVCVCVCVGGRLFVKLQPSSLNHTFLFNFNESDIYMSHAQPEVSCPLNRFAVTRILLK